MGNIKAPSPVKLFIGMLFCHQEVAAEAIKALILEFGPIDQQSDVWKFDFTNYYADEMGPLLWRQFIAFEKLIDPGQLKNAKIFTNQLEARLAKQYAPPPRPINLDPGYLSLSKVILATTKDYSHRLYLGDGIYGEVTLRYQQKQYQFWEWTYPDYRSEHYQTFFISLRELYKNKNLIDVKLT